VASHWYYGNLYQSCRVREGAAIGTEVVVVAAVVVWAVLLGWMYRRSEPASRPRGLLLTVGWVLVAAPGAYVKTGGSVAATAATAVAGAAIVAVATRGRFETLLSSRGPAAQDGGDGEHGDQDDRDGRLGLTLILLGIAALGIWVLAP
jgi:hypothetical protein